MKFTIMRQIEIDAGHRVPDHSSKCFNIHGHRYKVQLYVDAEDLVDEGSETGMVRDFGVLRQALVEEVDSVYDHTLILSNIDPLVHNSYWMDAMTAMGCVIRLIGSSPTAENLACFWGKLLQQWAYNHPDGANQPAFHLQKVVVWETPNCYAVWEP